MTYPLSATKLATYKQCPQSYYFKYERGLKSPSSFGSTELGKAVHKTLADIYSQWSYRDPKPSWEWCLTHWHRNAALLDGNLATEGLSMLSGYYDAYIRPLTSMAKPLGVEGKLSATLRFDNIEFSLSGRYDRLDWLGDGLELFDYKTAKTEAISDATDVQLGLYCLALEQVYRRSLKRLTLLYLRSGRSVSFDATPEQQSEVRSLIADLALKLRADAEWMPAPGDHCGRCAYRKHCAATTPCPEPLPEDARSLRQVQLVLAV
ncbi:MAG: PD-(D/E)XK nuclease family protein [Thermosynechococcaceae cyanobacterium]